MQTEIEMTNLMGLPRLLKPKEISEILGVSRSFTYQLMQTGALPVVRLGKSCRVRPKDLEEFIEQNIHRQSTILT
jgi:excisionase family DNA binding protein